MCAWMHEVFAQKIVFPKTSGIEKLPSKDHFEEPPAGSPIRGSLK